MRNKAFTLIELLVVIAIIAILAAILFPVFAQAREKARQTQCLSNEKQLGLGLLQYLQDYDEYAPYGQLYQGNYACGEGWANEIYPYVKSTGVYVCPDDTNTTGPYMSYGANLNALYGAVPALPWMGTPVNNSAKWSAPSVSVAIFEMGAISTCNVSTVGEACSPVANGLNGYDFSSLNGGSYTPYYATGILNNATYNQNSNPNVYGRIKTGLHQGASNFLLLDGHVKYIQPQNVSAGVQPTSATANCISPSALSSPMAATFCVQ